MSEVFFTRFQLNPQRRGTLRLLGSPQRLHAAILSCYPPGVASGPQGGRVLWRVDSPSQHERNLFIVAPGRPSMEELQEETGWSQERSWKTVPYGPFLDRLDGGQTWRFRLTANPTRSTAGERGSRGKVSAHVTVEQQLDWLLTRTERHGFRSVGVDGSAGVTVTRRERESFDRGQPPDRRRVTLTRVQYDGLLEVTDRELLRTTLVGGIGRAKAYGCGLLTLASA